MKMEGACSVMLSRILHNVNWKQFIFCPAPLACWVTGQRSWIIDLELFSRPWAIIFGEMDSVMETKACKDKNLLCSNEPVVICTIPMEIFKRFFREFSFLQLFRCVPAFLWEGMSVRPFVRPCLREVLLSAKIPVFRLISSQSFHPFLVIFSATLFLFS